MRSSKTPIIIVLIIFSLLSIKFIISNIYMKGFNASTIRWLLIIFMIAVIPFLVAVLSNKKNFVQGLEDAFLILFLLFMAFPMGKQILALPSGRITGYSISIPDILLIFLIFLMFSKKILHTGLREKGKFNYGNWMFLSFFVWLLLSSLYSRDYLLSLPEFVRFLSFYAVFLYFANLKIDEKRGSLLVQILSFGILFHVMFSIFQAFTGTKIRFFGGSEILGKATIQLKGTNWLRLSSIWESPNEFAEYLVPNLIFLFVYLHSFITQRKKVVLLWIIFYTGVIVLIFTFSRGGWLSFFFSFCLMMLYYLKTKVIKIKQLAVPVIALGFLIFFFHDFILFRLTSEQGLGAIQHRIDMIKITLSMIKDHLIIGVGLNRFMTVAVHYDVYGIYRALFAFRYPVHSFYLLLAAEAGLVGLFLFLLLIVKSLNKIRKEILFKETYLKFPFVLRMGAFFAIIAMLIHMSVDIWDGSLQHRFFWMYLGIIWNDTLQSVDNNAG